MADWRENHALGLVQLAAKLADKKKSLMPNPPLGMRIRASDIDQPAQVCVPVKCGQGFDVNRHSGERMPVVVTDDRC